MHKRSKCIMQSRALLRHTSALIKCHKVQLAKCVTNILLLSRDLQPIRWRFSVAESFYFQTFQHSREPLLCKWLEKAIVRRVIASLGKEKGRHNFESCFIDKAVA